MKNLFKLLAFVIFLTLAACYENENIVQDEQQLKEEDIEISSKKLFQAGCDGIVEVSISGNQVTYSLPIWGYSNPIFEWSVTSSVNNSMAIVGINTNQNVVVSFDVANFEGGELKVNVYEYGNPTDIYCGDVLTLSEGDCPIPIPCDGISGTIIEDIDACYPASHMTLGRYHLNYAGNNNDVTWSVDYGTITSQSGASEVHVAAASLDPFTLTAIINTEEGCTKEINKVIYPCDANEGGFGK